MYFLSGSFTFHALLDCLHRISASPSLYDSHLSLFSQTCVFFLLYDIPPWKDDNQGCATPSPPSCSLKRLPQLAPFLAAEDPVVYYWALCSPNSFPGVASPVLLASHSLAWSRCFMEKGPECTFTNTCGSQTEVPSGNICSWESFPFNVSKLQLFLYFVYVLQFLQSSTETSRNVYHCCFKWAKTKNITGTVNIISAYRIAVSAIV